MAELAYPVNSAGEGEWRNWHTPKLRFGAERLLTLRPRGGIGIRARFRIWYRKVCRFKSCRGH